MSKRYNPSAPGRRGFLKLAAATGGTVAVIGASQGALALDMENHEPRLNPKPKGYHLTPHIEEYYTKARS